MGNPFDWVDDAIGAVGEAIVHTVYGLDRFVRKGGLERAVGEDVAEATKDIYTGGVKVPTRVLTTAYDFPMQVLNNTAAFIYNNNYASPITPINTGKGVVVGGGRGKGFKKATASIPEQFTGIVTNTTVGELIRDALPGGEKIDIGSGFFVGGDTQQDINERKKELYPTLYGHTFTVGRAFATDLADNGIITPDSTAWNVISGGIDLGWTIGADPTNWIPAGAVANLGKLEIPLSIAARAGKRAKVTTNLSKKSAKIIAEAADDGRVVMNAAGLIDNGRRTVNPNNWEAFKLTRKGQEWLNGFVGDKSGTAVSIWRKSNGKIPVGTAKKLADAQTFDEVVAVMDDAVYTGDPLVHVRIMPGLDPRPIVTRTGDLIKGNSSRYHLFDTLPESTDFPLNNPTKAVKNADSIMGVLRVDNDVRDDMINKLINVLDGTDDTAVFDWLDEFETTVVASQLKKWNYTDDEIRRIAGWRKRYEESISGFVTDQAGSSVPLEWLIGGPMGGYGPLLISQTLKVNPILIDPTDLRNIADRLGPIRSRLENMRRKVVEETVDAATGERIVEATKPVVWVNTPLALTESVGNIVDVFQSRVWKPNILIRPRYLIRTLPEENVRLMASGLFDHHYQYIAQLFTNRNSIDLYGRVITTSRQAAKIESRMNEAGRLVRKYQDLIASGETTYKGRLLTDLISEQQDKIDELTKTLDVYDERVGNELVTVDDALLRGMPRKTGDLMMNPAVISGMVKRGNLISVERAVNPDLWSKAIAQRLGERSANLHYREIAKMLRDGVSVDDIARRFDTGDLRKYLDEYLSKLGNKDTNYVWDLAGIRKFVQKTIDDINLYTFNGDPELLEAVINNEFMGEALSGVRGFKGLAVAKRVAIGKEALALEPNKVLKKYIKDNYSGIQSPNVPQRVNYFPSVFDQDATVKNAKDLMSERYDALLSLFWDGIYGASSDLLNRNPLWQQAKWQRVLELVPVMNTDEAAKLAQNVANSTLEPTLRDDIIELAANATGEMTINDVETLAELFATKQTKDTFFDASRKTQFGAAHRKMFPFFDAFVELTGSILKFATNPKIVHRADQAITELRQNTFLGEDIDGDGNRDPFLYRDPQSGQEMFAFSPPGGFLKEWRKAGLDFRFGNTLNGLSMVTNMYPSMSPWVALPITAGLPDTKDFDALRNLIAPYGVPDLTDPSFAQFFIPGASEQMLRILGSNGLELFSDVDEREKQMQAVIRALQVLRTVKDYDPATPGVQGPTGFESGDEWTNDARELGTKIYGLTGWAGLIMPGAPIAQWSAKTKKGNVLLSVLAKRWQQIDTEGDKLKLDYQDKLEWFVSEFGDENMAAFLQPITDRTIGGSTSTREFFDWYRDNKSVVDKYEAVGGYFSPKPGDLDPDVWNIQRISGDVKYKDPEQFAKNVESAIANFVYNRNMRTFEESIPPQALETEEAKDAIKAERKRQQEAVKKAYPNWDRAVAATTAKQSRERQMFEVRQFVAEPTQQDNAVVKTAQDYLRYRDANLQEVIRRAGGKVNEDNWKTMTANRAAIALRNSLWQKGEQLAEQNPGFVNLWQNVLSREFISVDVEE